jgi:hypothetical protein
VGDSKATVRAALGEPFAITWYGDLFKGPYVRFERLDGRWAATSADGVDVPRGTTMATLEERRALFVEMWRYSRACTSDQSERVRSLEFRAERVAARNAAVVFD